MLSYKFQALGQSQNSRLLRRAAVFLTGGFLLQWPDFYFTAQSAYSLWRDKIIIVFESVVLGTIQGIAEWLPISSEGMLLLAKTRFFGGADSLGEFVRTALFLHLGTFAAALVYLRSDVARLLRALWRWRSTTPELRRELEFLLLATVISGALGALMLALLERIDRVLQLTVGNGAYAGVGAMLLITGLWQLRARTRVKGMRHAGEAARKDALLLGVAQGLAVLPGLSRSGITVAALLLRGFDDAESLRLSFLLSLPIVLFGNIVLNVRHAAFSAELFLGVLAAFFFGLITMHALLAFARRVQFGVFVCLFGLLMFVAALLPL